MTDHAGPLQKIRRRDMESLREEVRSWFNGAPEQRRQKRIQDLRNSIANLQKALAEEERG